ncbi:TVP38/TMEM64 family protein [Ectobacillus ponti]|uniref:TVP38/TMEM64 family membrane protein n=1 Tax=Ectobacillus ponti TaxID=2961894 RepID=A0AA41X5U2_9BACI|nr:VTT domain-containing protein [Ectobacillus ponti]MCP8969486.1 VTT domain-containing protein [Ectobacillus ponti]
MNWDIPAFLEGYGLWAVPVSILLNILISVAGLLPSFFLTAANLASFGIVEGTLISIAGEAIGAIVSFLLYRRGLRRTAARKTSAFPAMHRLLQIEGQEAFWLILSLRLLPFAPSGLVTLFAALGTVSLPVFAAASTIGKIPALLLEVYSTYQVLKGTSQAKWVIGALAAFGVLYVWRRNRQSKS